MQKLIDDVVGIQRSYFIPRQVRLDVPDDNNPPSRHWITIREAVRRREEFGLSAAEIARHLGVVTSNITRAIEKMVETTA